jgi:hypothetical protein
MRPICRRTEHRIEAPLGLRHRLPGGRSPSSGSLVRWGRTSRCWRVRLSQLLMRTPAPVISDGPPYQKPESGEGRR